ncbi:type II toxin-antitoxin system VapC family toxin [Sphingomonas mollis]|uniref:Type II toxin-antitoxin system VapC family toxin n=1 Tax=Sphingomonas mollis TaxID=2795726 RepID=A0ABS0XSA6_9SPHN|nr:type II toxin-antitoxin system VapC family toxin [Sphingomonas sp. BT553]
MSRLLLDTHVVLFWWARSSKLGEAAQEAISLADTEVHVSVATGWEIATKFRIGKLAFVGDPAIHMPQMMEAHRFVFLPIKADHALRAGSLPGDHRDPFDRMIAAQALIEDMTVVTRDPEIAGFGCKVLW